MSDVRMRHPDLPDQEVSVPESAVPHHAAAGWQRVPDDPPADSIPSEAPEDSGASSVKSTPTTPKRRSSKEA